MSETTLQKVEAEVQKLEAELQSVEQAQVGIGTAEGVLPSGAEEEVVTVGGSFTH